MLNKFIIGILVLSTNTLFSQNNRIYEPFRFENYQPIWVHSVIDSSIIGSFKELDWNGDSIFYDGFSHFFSNDIYKVDPVFYNNKLIINELNNGAAAQGGFVQCVDIKTGKEIWNDHFDSRTDTRKEYPRSAYINDDGQLEILGLRQNFKMPNTQPKPLWQHALMTIRKYNIETGELEERILTDENDPLAHKMITPFYLYLDAWLHSYLVRNGKNYQYILEDGQLNSFVNGQLNSFVINDHSFVMDSSVSHFNPKYKEYSTRLYSAGQDKFIHLYYSATQNEFYKKDSFELIYNLFDNNLELLNSIDLHDQIIPAYKYLKIFNNDKFFILLCEDILNQGENYLPLMTYSLFDIGGNLIEQVTLRDEFGKPIKYNLQYGAALKLPYEKGMLIMVEIVEDGYPKLAIIKSKGEGEFIFLKKLKILDTDHYMAPLDLYLTNEGNILLKALDINLKLFDNNYNGYATNYILFSAEDLGIKTSINEIVESKPLLLYPNPASSSISISCENNDASTIEIIDRLGRVVYRDKSSGCEETSIDISGYASGLYFVRLMDDEGRVLGKGKFVKE